MSIVSTDLIAYGCASLPADDVSTTGGAIDTTRRPAFTQLTANAIIECVSDGTDTRTVTVTGRKADGTVATEAIVLTGTTAKDGLTTFERIQKIEVSATDPARTVTCKQGAGGSTIATIPLNEIGFYMLFLNSSATTSSVVRYEKLFWKNTNATLALTAASVTLTADPAGKVTLGIGTIGGTTSVTNRLTAPAGIVFVGVNTAQNIPGGGTLGIAQAIEVWIKQSLLANDAAQKNTFSTLLGGSST